MDQPTAEEALRELEPLIGEWTLEAIPPGASLGRARRGPPSSGTTPGPT
jgi:hypothetical protein